MSEPIAVHERVGEIARRLRIMYGVDPPPHADGDPIGELVGTILGQNTSDVNSSRAFASLRRCFPTWRDVVEAPEARVAEAIRVGGLANIKARRIKQCLSAIVERFGRLDLSSLRHADTAAASAALRSLPGVGPKTAACVLLFSLGHGTIPVDTHVHRVGRRLGLIGPRTSADAAHRVLEQIVRPEDAHAIHVGLVRHGREICRAARPCCAACQLADLCDYYRANFDGEQKDG